jgi:rRNA processing protein Krr1/Pno1
MNQSLARAVHDSDGDGNVGPFLLDHPPDGSPSDCISDEMRIDQRYVGWLLGKSGGVVREIEQKSGCKISINQDTKRQGYSKALFYGSQEERQQARQLIEESIARAKGNEGSQGNDDYSSNPLASEDELQIGQKWVGFLLGQRGGLIKEIEQECSVRISIDQSTKEQGYSTIKISGDPENRQNAKDLIVSKVAKVGGICTGAGMGEAFDEVEVEQRLVGWLLGKSGQVTKEMEQKTGARIKVDQSNKDRGYSIVSISGSFDRIAAAKTLLTE